MALPLRWDGSLSADHSTVWPQQVADGCFRGPPGLKLARNSKVAAALATAARSSLCRRGATIVFVAMLLINGALVYPLLQHTIGEHRREVVERTTDYLVTAAGAGRFPTIDVLVSAGRQLAAGTDIVGGVFVNSSGEERGVFGERPRLTWAQIQLSPDGEGIHRIIDGRYHEFFIPPSRSAISFGTIVRVDGRGMWAAVRVHLLEFAILGLAATLAITIVAAGVMAAIVMEPTMRIRQALLLARDAPHEARAHLKGLGRSSEFGQMARAMDGVLSVMESLQIDDALTPHALIERLPNAVVARDLDGQVVFANEAALSLFGMHVIGDFADFDWENDLIVEGQAGRLDVLLDNGRFRTGAEIMRAGEILACLVSGQPVLDADRRRVGSCLVFTEANELLADMRQERQEREAAEAVSAAMQRRAFALSHMLEACIALLGEDDSVPSNITVSPDRFISRWLEQNDMVAGIRHGVLPPIMGDPESVGRLVEWALAAIAVRSASEKPSLAVDTEIDGDGNVEYIFREIDRETKANAPVAPGTDITVLIAAMHRTLQRQEGRLAQTGGGSRGNVVSLVLPLDAVGLAVLETERKKRDRKAA